jgi:transglutaminase-like putative cysteine protease
MKYLTLFLLLTVGTVESYAQKPKEVSVKFMYDIFPGQETKRIRLTCHLPLHIPKRQEVVAIKYSVLPDSIINEDSNSYAVFLMDPPERKMLTVEVKLLIYKNDYKTTKRRGNGNADVLPEDSIAYFLRAERFIDKEDARITAQALQLSAGDDTLSTLWNIHGYVKEAFPYKVQKLHIGAANALTFGQGDCSEYADLFVALCRDSHIPARVVDGFVVKDDGSIGWHAWAEAFVHGYGWIPFDATGYRASFRSLDNKYVYLSRAINDKRLNYRHHFTYRYWGASAKVLHSTQIW